MTRKLLLVPLLLVLACLFAGAYGALHNQVSYTVSSEYFTRFKFEQFRISESVPERLGAAMVGFAAAWWMGLVIGLILIPSGFGIRGVGSYFATMLRAFAAVTITTSAVGLVALGAAFLLLDAETVGQITRYDWEILDDLAFARAGTMHNFSYAGGVLGIIGGAVVIYRAYQRQRMPTSKFPAPDTHLPS